MVAIRSPFCGYNTELREFVELRDKDLVCYSNKITLEFVSGNVYTIVNLSTNRIYVISQQGTFIRLVLTRWRLKPYSIDMERNYVTVTLCIYGLRSESEPVIAKFHYTDTDTDTGPTWTRHGQSPRTLSGTS